MFQIWLKYSYGKVVFRGGDHVDPPSPPPSPSPSPSPLYTNGSTEGLIQLSVKIRENLYSSSSNAAGRSLSQTSRTSCPLHHSLAADPWAQTTGAAKADLY